MNTAKPRNREISPSEPVEIAPRTWWVGYYHEGDPFQCHAYLIEQGDQSVLIDPGSRLTFRYTLAKIERIVPFSSIRWFVCQHQDPDITGALPVIDELASRCAPSHPSTGRSSPGPWSPR